MKKLSIIGIGKLGLCFALILEKHGYNVLGVDLHQSYVDLINTKQYRSSEPGLNDLLDKSKWFRATTSMREAVEHSDTLFVIVATPSLPDGRYSHAQVDSVIQKLKEIGRQETQKNLVITCTVMPGYCDSIKDQLLELNYVVSYNPEFIAQGTILRDQENPDMVLIGEANKTSGDLLQEIYETHTVNKPKFARMTPLEAEITKIGLNCFLTTKIAYANMVGDIVKKAGGNPDMVLSAIGSDSRVGNKFLKYGYGFGGPCLKPSQLVQTKNGLKPIIRISVGDYVLTHRGRYRKVIKNYAKPYDGELIVIKSDGFGNKNTPLTPNHPVLIERQNKKRLFVAADELMTTDKIIMPKMTIENRFNKHKLILAEKEYYSGLVYNLEVDEDESYVLENCTVHNCLPRDGRALGIFAKDLDMPSKISNAADESNKLHLQEQIEFFKNENKDKLKAVKFDSVTYKQESNLIEESQQLLFAVGLAKEGYKVVINERKDVVEEVKKIYGDLFQYEVKD